VKGWPRSRPSANTIRTTAPATAVRVAASWSIWRCSGVRSALAAPNSPAMAPIWVSMPVAVTTRVARPRVTRVFMKTMSVRSARAASGSPTPSTSLATGWDSPVRAASCTSRATASASRPSAGTLSPASTSTTSPGTSSSAGISCTAPPRSTLALATVMCRSACRLASALRSWRKLIMALNTTTTRMTTGVSHSRETTALTAAAISSTTTSRSWNGRSNARQVGSRSASRSRFGPNRVRRSATCPSSRPRSGVTARAAATTATSRVCQGRAPSETLVMPCAMRPASWLPRRLAAWAKPPSKRLQVMQHPWNGAPDDAAGGWSLRWSSDLGAGAELMPDAHAKSGGGVAVFVAAVVYWRLALSRRWPAGRT
jgi:hypothetical protein